MIISSESVLRKIPALLSRQQALFIEGIRFSIEMADLSHRRLLETLPKLTAMETGQSGENGVSAMLDAWSMVDSLHRLRGLLGNLPRIKHRDRILEIRTFFDTTKTLRICAIRFNT